MLNSYFRPIVRFRSETKKYISATDEMNINVSINVHFFIFAHVNTSEKLELIP